MLALPFKTNWVTPIAKLEGVDVDLKLLKPYVAIFIVISLRRRSELDECRVIKSAEEIKLMRYINDISRSVFPKFALMTPNSSAAGPTSR